MSISTILLLSAFGAEFDFFVPQYPKLALQARLSGIVKIRFNAEDKPVIISGHPLLMDACRSTLQIEGEGQLENDRAAKLHEQLRRESIKEVECHFKIVMRDGHIVKRPLILKILSFGLLSDIKIEPDWTPLAAHQMFEIGRLEKDVVQLTIRSLPLIIHSMP